VKKDTRTKKLETVATLEIAIPAEVPAVFGLTVDQMGVPLPRAVATQGAVRCHLRLEVSRRTTPRPSDNHSPRPGDSRQRIKYLASWRDAPTISPLHKAVGASLPPSHNEDRQIRDLADIVGQPLWLTGNPGRKRVTTTSQLARRWASLTRPKDTLP
jgi:hypothetical protein